MNSIYYKIMTIYGYSIKMEVFLDTGMMYYSIYSGEDLLEEDFGNYEEICKHIKSLMIDFNTSNATEFETASTY